MCFQPKNLKSENNNPWFKPWFYILLDTQSIVCATVDSQCLEYLGYITLTTGSNSKSKAIWYIPNIWIVGPLGQANIGPKWCIGLLQERNAKNDKCLIFFGDETDLLNPLNNVWEYWQNQNNFISSNYYASGVSISCTKRKKQKGTFL